ncbi:MAG TPA: class I SAM-dependent rRNA methyltransferase [Chloroflexia bacterium]|nr:class I SAM-dependent rRNA methyltransferase [Chloroflexia bacterium]
MTQAGQAPGHPRVVLAPGRQKRLLAGHPWIYNNEVAQIAGAPAPGDTVDVLDTRGTFLARGYYNPQSQIVVRVLTRREEPVDAAFFARRIRRAWAQRQRLLPDVSCCRVVFGEADFLPGLIVDKFGDLLVLQSLALGIDRWQPAVVTALQEVLAPAGIYERNDAPIRALEGLPLRTGFLWGAADPHQVIEENGLRLAIDVATGQKTGYYLDQQANRRAIRAYSAGARVLDCFCNVGGFALNAVAGGAAGVVAVDSSTDALALAWENAGLNGMQDRLTTEEGNAFDVLKRLNGERARFDLIILDPPPFAKNRAAVAGALRGYKEINLRALRMIPDGGFLVTCSCSFHMTPALFRAVVAEAALDAGRRLRLVEERAQNVDHPILAGYEESHYLKCLIYEVVIP